jgi:hypothetical protein
LRPPQDEEVFDGIKKISHPEGAAKQLSQRTHCANPADLQFFHTFFPPLIAGNIAPGSHGLAASA